MRRKRIIATASLAVGCHTIGKTAEFTLEVLRKHYDGWDQAVQDAIEATAAEAVRKIGVVVTLQTSETEEIAE